MNVYVCVFIHVCMYFVCMCFEYMCVFMCICMFLYIYMFICMCVCVVNKTSIQSQKDFIIRIPPGSVISQMCGF